MSTPNERKKGCVVIADDDPAILWLIRTLVENEGFSVMTAMDGKEANRIVKSDTS